MAEKYTNIDGLAEVVSALRAFPAALRRGALRNALAAGGRVFRDEARRLTPIIAVPVRRKATGQVVRKPGTVRDAISVRTSKRDKSVGDVGVFVNVRPAKGAKFKTQTKSTWLGGKQKTRIRVRASQRGADSPNDPFYWRWLEFGTKNFQGIGMLKRSVAKTSEALQQINKAMARAVERMNRKGGTKQ